MISHSIIQKKNKNKNPPCQTTRESQNEIEKLIGQRNIDLKRWCELKIV